ncbi:TLC domain-containing 2-like [Brachionus plicatilis]|uniref:TLC domain-containing 2-like n=1 Tax=Brachionus plicatilis TaxID=10195 RepID=A0A3M7SI83_BRAPC|nr:TLC domain-containing 2-like [Brachionus plicatilis]
MKIEDVPLFVSPNDSILVSYSSSVHDYLNQLSYRNLIVICLILMFSIVFYLISLIVDSVVDKQKHYELSVKSFERYEQAVLRRRRQEDDAVFKIREESEEMEARNGKLAFTIWTNRNLQVSFVHSVLCSLWLLYILIARHSELFADLLYAVTWDAYLVLAFSCGYFLYDFYDICANGYLKREWVVCVHHWIVLLSFGYHMINLISIGYTVVALLMEFNSVFLHARKLLKFYAFKRNSCIVYANCVANILSFVVFRFGILGLIMYSFKVDGHRVSLQYLCMLIAFVLIMTVINVILFKRIIQKDVRILMCAKAIKQPVALHNVESVDQEEKRVDTNHNVVLLVEKN